MAPELHARLARLSRMEITQMMHGTANDSNSPTPLFRIRKPRRKHMFRNYYCCPYDRAAWINEWSCMCNDRCPMCRAEIEPCDSEDIWALP